jgi:hypothetical protein
VITGGQGTNSITYTAGDGSVEATFKLVVTSADGCKDSCEVTFGCTPPEHFCTYTQGGWGSGCPDSQKDRMKSPQPGCIRDHFFAQVFPNGVIIGDPNGPDGDNFYAAKWTTAAAVEAFLPGTGTPGKLTHDLTNPTSTPAGVLAGQLLALRLNVEFSCAGIFLNLGMPGTCFSSFVIPESCGKFAGLTVTRFQAIADSAVGGKLQALVPFGATLSDVNYTANCLNEMFDECGNPDDAMSSGTSTELSGESSQDLTPAVPKDFTVRPTYPNPFNPMTTISYGLPAEGRITIEIYDIVGRKVVTLLDAVEQPGYSSVNWYGKDEGGTIVASGVYFCRVQFGNKADIKKMILLK